MSEGYIHGGCIASSISVFHLHALKSRAQLTDVSIFCDCLEMIGFTGLAEGASRPGLPRWESSDYDHS